MGVGVGVGMGVGMGVGIYIDSPTHRTYVACLLLGEACTLERNVEALGRGLG